MDRTTIAKIKDAALTEFQKTGIHQTCEMSLREQISFTVGFREYMQRVRQQQKAEREQWTEAFRSLDEIITEYVRTGKHAEFIDGGYKNAPLPLLSPDGPATARQKARG